MLEATEAEQGIELTGKSGNHYSGKIYADKASTSTITGRSIVVLTNSTQDHDIWTHNVNSIYNTEDINNELSHFKSRDDISHLILIPYKDEGGVMDKVDDLIRAYIHR